jgi:hypothetical protein
MTKERFSGDVFTKLIEIVDFIFKAVFFYQYLAIFLTRITSYTIIYTFSIQYIMGQRVEIKMDSFAVQRTNNDKVLLIVSY